MPYIHELSAWPKMGWDDRVLSPRLAQGRYRQGRLFSQMQSLGFRGRAETNLASLTTDVVTSSAIEGEFLDADEVRSSIARRLGLDIGRTKAAGREVEGVVEMMLDATQGYARPLTAERLWSWHAALFPTGRSGLQKITVGVWRPLAAGAMQVVSGPIGRERIHFEAPTADRLDSEMEKFLDWFAADSGIDLVLKAGIAHFWFVTIHPFEDGNGRIGRAIMDMALAQAEGTSERSYSMSGKIEAERKEYYRRLEHTQRGGLDITFWLEWFLDCFDRALAGAEETLASVLRKARTWEWINQGPVNERQRTVINRLLDQFEGKLTTAKYAKLAKCSPDTALRDIQALVDRGVLGRDKAGGRSTSYHLTMPPA